MTLTDSQIIEMHELCGALADDCMTEVQRERLTELLKRSDEAREIYFHSVSLSASLAEYANEMQSDEATLPIANNVRHVNFRWWALGALAAAACVALGLFLWPRSTETQAVGREDLADADLQSGGLVARITGAKDCVWNGRQKLEPGAPVHRGEHLDLVGGVAEITFDCGAQIVLEGPAVLNAESAWQATLLRGGLKATVPPQAVGFRVHHASVEVVDLGTEFSMVADAAGEADVRVLKGSIEVAPVNSEETAPVVMKENESRRFGKARKNERRDFDDRHARLAKALPMEHWNQHTSFAHWSFNELANGVLKADVTGLAGTRDAKIETGNASTLLTEGRWQKALRLDGSTTLSAHMPSLSMSAARTIAFWVRVPEDAQLSDSHSMVAWQTRNKKLGNRALQIGWNRNPSQGTLGALRTDLGKIYAMGATSLRDGQWHHVAVVFIPIGSEDGPVHVTQYVDGKLEGTTVRGLKMKRAAQDSSKADVLWLGRAPGKRMKGGFRGDMDELFVTERALSPAEIVLLKTENQAPRLDLTDTSPLSNTLIAEY